MAASVLKLSILSPERRLVESLAVQEVILPGSEGEIQILPGHTAIIGTLETGIFQYQSFIETIRGVISYGFFYLQGDHLQVMAQTLELEGEIDLDRAKQAQKKAEEALEQAHLDASQFKKFELKIRRAIIRQQLGNGDRSSLS